MASESQGILSGEGAGAAETLAQKQKREAPQTAGACQLLVSRPDWAGWRLGKEPGKLCGGAWPGGPGQTWPLAIWTPRLFCHPQDGRLGHVSGGPEPPASLYKCISGLLGSWLPGWHGDTDTLLSGRRRAEGRVKSQLPLPCLAHAVQMGTALKVTCLA